MSNKTSTHEPGKKPTFLVVEDFLYFQSKAGDEIRLDLDFPSSFFDEIEEGTDERDQFFQLLPSIVDEQWVEKIRAMGALEQSRLIKRYYAEFAKAVRADLGESAGSSDS
jgi:hypothetical protein